MSVNQVALTGNLTRDPELRATQGGTPVLSLSIAVNDRRKNPQTGDWEDYPNFVDCTMFGTRAEAVSRYLSKGTKVAIEGKLRYSSWERDGQRRSKLEVIVNEIEFMSRQSAEHGNPPYVSDNQQAPAHRNAVQAPAAVQNAVNQTFSQSAAEVYDEDIPF
nr:MAG TPA: Single strand binding protein [Caudoviricetes sp.]